MSKIITVKLRDDIFEQSEKLRPIAKLNRNAYINEAVKRFNMAIERMKLAEQFRSESILVRDHSMEVLSDFEMLSDKISE